MSEAWAMQLTTNQNYIYRTKDIKNPQESSFTLNIIKRKVLTDEAVSGNELQSKAKGEPRIIISFDWRNSVEALCKEKEAEKQLVKVEPEYDCEWTIEWKDKDKGFSKYGGCWKLEPDENTDVSEEFSFSATFHVKCSTALEGGAVMYVSPENIPGFTKGAVFLATIYKISPIEISFKGEPEYVEYGEKTLLTWEVKNADYCTLNFEPCNLEDNLEEEIYESKTFMLAAQNTRGKLEFKRAQVKLTNWKSMAVLEGDNASIFKSSSAYNYKILEYKGSMYVYANECIYKSEGGAAWSKVSASTLKETASLTKFTTLVSDDRVYVLGSGGPGSSLEDNCVVYYSFSEKIWGKQPLITEVNIGCSAVRFKGKEFFINITGGKELEVIVYDAKAGDWSSEYSMSTDELEYSIGEIAAMDAAKCVNELYLAIKDKDSKTVYILNSKDGYQWEEYWRVDETIEGWFRLVPYGDDLLLLHSGGVLPVINTRKVYRNFLPELKKEQEIMPWYGSCNRAMWLTVWDGTQMKASLWRFKG